MSLKPRSAEVGLELGSVLTSLDPESTAASLSPESTGVNLLTGFNLQAEVGLEPGSLSADLTLEQTSSLSVQELARDLDGPTNRSTRMGMEPESMETWVHWSLGLWAPAWSMGLTWC